jgi:SAM-dependent methyltransferase
MYITPAPERDSPFPPGSFDRLDESDDALFYAEPRKVVHLDDAALAALTALYAELLPPQGPLLDLMSSWRSHLPEGYPGPVIGLGMNEEEMADNPQLSSWVVHDLNQEPMLPFEDNSFTGAMCAVSVQYLTNPIAVFQEVCRVLKPGAPFIVTFSNRCFPTKAVAIWRATTDWQHLRIVRLYFERSGGWEGITSADRSPPTARDGGDPLYAVWAWKRRS